jgi:3-oxoacyl-[acyl-carrier protein] reductase
MSKLAGKVAVVTGASKGIGASIATELAAEGAAVVVNYASDKAGAEKVVKGITDKGGKAVAVQASVDKAEDVARLFGEVKKNFGHVDVLVNNAGVYEFNSLEQITATHFNRLFNINVLGLLQVTQEALPLFPESGGSIINIGSVAAAGVPGAAVYSATKGAVDSITGALAQELGPKKIRVNSLNPGMIETEGVHAAGFLGTDFHKNIVATTPLGRIGQPKDIGTVAAFLASEDSGWLTGEELKASGGNRL